MPSARNSVVDPLEHWYLKPIGHLPEKSELLQRHYPHLNSIPFRKIPVALPKAIHRHFFRLEEGVSDNAPDTDDEGSEPTSKTKKTKRKTKRATCKFIYEDNQYCGVTVNCHGSKGRVKHITDVHEDAWFALVSFRDEQHRRQIATGQFFAPMCHHFTRTTHNYSSSRTLVFS